MRGLWAIALLVGCHCEEQTFVWLSRSVSAEELALAELEESEAYDEADCIRLCTALVDSEPRGTSSCTLVPWSPEPADSATPEGVAWIECWFDALVPCD